MQLPFSLQPLFDVLGAYVGGPANAFILVLALIKIALILGGLLQIVPVIILIERKVIAFIQDRPGPNRAGPFGILHGFLDGVKLLFKEEIMPKGVDKVLFMLAPSLVVVPAFLALCLVPVGPIISGDHLNALGNFFQLDPAMVSTTGIVSEIALAITNPNVGILYVLAITSVGVYGVTLAGWSSNSKWSLLGGIRASAQMISYEITLSLAIIGAILVSGHLNLYDIIETQKGGFWNWHVVAQPVAFLLFLIAMFAETNRVPFDLAEAEAELTGGFHTEYSSMKFALFFLAEYVNMVVVSAMISTLFLGGFYGPVQMEYLVPGGWAGVQTLTASTLGESWGVVAAIGQYALGPMLIVPAKISVFIFLFIFIRATLPRFRYDQLMDLGWKVMLPIGLINLVITATVVGIDLAIRAGMPGKFDANPNMLLASKVLLGGFTLSLLIFWDVFVFSRRRKAQLAADYIGLRPGMDSTAAVASLRPKTAR